MEDYELREVRRVLERIEETSNKILKQLEEQTTELHSMGVNVAIVDWDYRNSSNDAGAGIYPPTISLVLGVARLGQGSALSPSSAIFALSNLFCSRIKSACSSNRRRFNAANSSACLMNFSTSSSV